MDRTIATELNYVRACFDRAERCLEELRVELLHCEQYPDRDHWRNRVDIAETLVAGKRIDQADVDTLDCYTGHPPPQHHEP